MPARQSADRLTERVTRLEGDHAAHTQIDDLRIGGLTTGMDEVKHSVTLLQEEVRSGFAAVRDAIHAVEITVATIGAQPAQGSPTPRERALTEYPDLAEVPGRWQVGPVQKWLIGIAVAAVIAVMGWMGDQLWIEEPARVYAYEHPIAILAPVPPK